MSEAVPAGLYEVSVDYSALQPRVNLSVFDDVEADMLLLESMFPPPSQPNYYLYLVTPPGQPVEYVMRLPYFLSETCFLKLSHFSFTATPTWYTFHSMQSVLCITFSTSTPEADIVLQLQDLVRWVEECESWAVTYREMLPPTVAPNISRIVCHPHSICLLDHDKEAPVWLPSQPGALLDHTITLVPPSPDTVMPEWVKHLCGSVDAYSMHARFPSLTRYHVELRHPTPLPPQGPPSLSVGDWVIYLMADKPDELVCAEVKEIRVTAPYSLVLDTRDAPTYVAKFDPTHHCLLSELQSVSSFSFLSST